MIANFDMRAGGRRIGAGVVTLVVLLAIVALGWIGLPAWLVDYPESMVWKLAAWGTDAIKYVVNDLTLAGITLSEVSRMFAGLLEIPVDLTQGMLAEGFEFYRADGTATTLPPLPMACGLRCLHVVRVAAGRTGRCSLHGYHAGIFPDLRTVGLGNADAVFGRPLPC